ncbi:hypothetical protein [Rothia sp. P5766]|uniref:hypothetical protein n=1 Tax=Rothia sp. P5766 TaxID=3402656 RepID=UPI003AEDF767
MKNTASLSIKRAGVTIALAGALLATTGCGYIYKQPTTIVYSASDGQMTNLTEANKEIIQFRNIMVISSAEGAPGRVLGTILNQSEKDATVTLAFPGETLTIEVPAGKEVRLEDKANEIVLKSTEAAPGLSLKTTVSSDVTSEPAEFVVPVLDGTLEEYASYLPNAASASATETSQH